MKRMLALLWAFCMPAALWAQDGDVLLNDETYQLLDRVDIQNRTEEAIPTDFKPLGREQVAEILQSVSSDGMGTRALRWLDRARYQIDDDYATDRAKGLLKYFYRNGRDLLHYKSDKFRVYVNPQLYLSAGLDRADAGGKIESKLIYRNTKGVTLRGSIFRKVGFYFDLSDNQAAYPSFVNQQYNSLKTLWGESFVKPFGATGFDFLNTRGYITYSPIKNIRIKFGRDRAFAGNGYQSLFLSDNAVDHLLLNIRTRFWKFEYINHFTQMVDFIPGKPDAYGSYPRKWGVFHQLSLHVTRNVSVSFFESTVYGSTQPNGNRGFELQYINPIIFYRSVEQYIGSPDNGFMGFQVKANLFKRLQLYGQILIDDYNFGQRKSGGGWWGNKFGFQAGAKYIDFLGVETLDLQVETNRVTPYTYAHYNTSANYSNYGQYLGHASGANLQDFQFIARYNPLPRLFLYASFTYMMKGLDKDGLNYGGDVFQTNNTHNNGLSDPNFGNKVGQGDKLHLKAGYLRASYQLFNLNAFAELEAWLRSDKYLTTTAVLLSLRLNITNKPIRF